MFRLIEAGVAAMLIDLAALVIFAPLLALTEEIFGVASTATSISALLGVADPVFLDTLVLMVAIAAIATSTKALRHTAATVREASRKMDPRNPFSAALRLESICALAAIGFAVLLFQPHCPSAAAAVDRLQVIRVCTIIWPVAAGAAVAFFGATARAAGDAAR